MRANRPVTALVSPALAAMALVWLAPAQAQSVPYSGHVWRQAQAQVNQLTTATVQLHAQRAQGAMNAAPTTPVAGQGLSLGRWTGRAGVALDRDANPVKDSYVLAQPANHGLKLRSLHILSDVDLGSGFRASAGLVQGNITQAWWGDGDADGGLQLSIQQLDRLGLLGSASNDTGNDGLRPYLGAGYSVSRELGADQSTWHFSADLGITPRNNDSGTTRRISGEGFQLSPVLKFSMRYTF